jgi:hypothetical protein
MLGRGFIACFPLNVLMAHSPKPIIIANGNTLTGVGFTLGETIRFGSLEFIADHFGVLSRSSEVNDSDIVFMGMVHSDRYHYAPSLRNPPMRMTPHRMGGGALASPSHKDATW